MKADRLIAAIEKAVKADLERRKAEDGIAAARTLWDTLTPREKEVAKGVAAGDLNKQVAVRLGIIGEDRPGAPELAPPEARAPGER